MEGRFQGNLRANSEGLFWKNRLFASLGPRFPGFPRQLFGTGLAWAFFLCKAPTSATPRRFLDRFPARAFSLEILLWGRRLFADHSTEPLRYRGLPIGFVFGKKVTDQNFLLPIDEDFLIVIALDDALTIWGGRLLARRFSSLAAFFAFLFPGALDRFDGLVEGSDFVRCEWPIGSFGEFAEFQRADPDALEGDHPVSESRQDPSDLSVLSFAEGDFQFGTPFPNALEFGVVDPGTPLRKMDAPLQTFQGVRLDLTSDRYRVSLRDSMTRMGQPLSEFAVIGQQDQSGAAGIQAAYREQSNFIGYHIHHARSTLRVSVRAQDSFGLVKRKIDGAMLAQRFAIHGDNRFFWVDFDSDLLDCLAVDFDPSLLDQLIDLSARAQAGARKNFIDALFSLQEGGGRGTRGATFLHGVISRTA